MAERSRAASFPRARLLVGLVLVFALGAGLAFLIGKLRPEPGPGRLIYAARQGVFEHDLGTGRERDLLSLPPEVEAAMPSPDGSYVAFVLGQGSLWLAGLDGDETRFEVADQLTFPVGWSPDGRLVAGELLGDRDLVAIDPEGGREILLQGGYASGSVPVWISENRFAITRDEDTFVVVDDGERTFTEDGAPLAVSPDGAELLFVKDESVYVAKIGDGGLSAQRRIVRRPANFAAASPGGFAAIATENGVYVLEGGTKTTRVVDRPVDWVGWSRAGAILLYSYEGAAYALDLAADEAEPKRLTPAGTDVFSVLAFAVVP